jgi:hypothetical protein
MLKEVAYARFSSAYLLFWNNAKAIEHATLLTVSYS